MTSLDRSNDYKLLLALGHPMRRRILRLMTKGETTSPRELAIVLEAPLSRVSYHVRVLADCAAVCLVRTTPVRGSTQHFYRGAVEAPWALAIIEMNDREDESAGESPGG